MGWLTKFFTLICFISPLLGRAVVIPTNSPPVQIVMCREDANLDAVMVDFNITPTIVFRGLKGFAAPMNAASVQNLKSDDRILSVEADGPVSLCVQTNATGIERMRVDQFPVSRINGFTEPLDVGVAVIDSGIDPHPDLNVVGFFSPFTSNPMDQLGHGTTVAGVIGSLDNDFGMVGVAPGVRLWNIKTFDPTHNNWSYILTGMDYILDHASEISVVNMSFVNEGTTAPIQAIRSYVRDLVNAGIVVVVGAGNSTNDLAGADSIFGTGDDFVPAALSEAMAISAMNPTDDTFGKFSNFSQITRTNIPAGATTANYVISSGGAIDLAAPGVNILTTYTNGGYRIVSGTSVAAPHVTGLVALYIAANGRATNAEGVYKIRQAIVDASLPQSQWNTNNTQDPDTNPEPLAIASEAWIPKPVLTNSGAPGNFQLSFAAVPGYDYALQSATNLTAPILWKTLSTNFASSNVISISVTDTNAASDSFYRLHSLSIFDSIHLWSQPQSRTNLVGTTATMNVAVTGQAPSYRWHKGGTPLSDDGKISGATTETLTVTGVQSVDAGNYTVVITNVYGSVTSAEATLTVQSTMLLTGVLATATSELTSFGRLAANAVNGVFYDGNFWESVGVGQGFGTDASPAITFDLGTVRFVEKAQIWNGHETGPSIKRMLVEISSDGVNFGPVGEFALTTISPASEMIALGRVSGRYVRFTILENGDGQIFPVVGPPTAGTFVAIDEVEFHEYLPD